MSVKDTHYGNIAADSKNDPSVEAAGFSAKAITLNHWDQTSAGPVPVLDCHSAQIACKCAELKGKIDHCPSPELEEGPKLKKPLDVAMVDVVPGKLMCTEVAPEKLVCNESFPVLLKAIFLVVMK